METKQNNHHLPSPGELNKLFSEIGADSALAQIYIYASYRRNYLVPSLKFSFSTYSQSALNDAISQIEPDVFFDTYYSGYCAVTKPFSYLRSFFPEITLDATNECLLLSLLYLLFYMAERFPYECLWLRYKRLKSKAQKIAIIPSYEDFCRIWEEFFVLPYIRFVFPDLDLTTIDETLIRLGINTAYTRSLMILYVVVYRDFRECECRKRTVEKLRDDYDPIEGFKSPQAVFTYKNFDETKPRSLNMLFERTVPQSFTQSDSRRWKKDFSYILESLSRCSLDFLINLFIPEVFPSVSTVITFLSNFPSSKNHSSERKAIEVICAFLYALESEKSNQTKEFKTFLKTKICRDGLKDYKGLYAKLEKLKTSYAVINFKSENNYKRVFERAKLSVINSSKPRHENKVLLDFYMDSHNRLARDTENLCRIPALSFLMESQKNCRDSKVEDGIIFEEAANTAMLSPLRKVVLLQPSFSFLHKWLSDYRTKNLETTVVLYDSNIVDCLNQKLAEDNLISKKMYYSNQETSYQLHIVNSIDSIAAFDLALSFYRQSTPGYEDLIELSKLVSHQNKLLCVLPHKFFEADKDEAFRREMASALSIKRVTYFSSVLFESNPKKRYLVEFGKKETNQINNIALRSFEIDKSIHIDKNNFIKSDSGIYFLAISDEKSLNCNAPYNGEAIDFSETNTEQKATENKRNYSKAQQVSFAPDFSIYYTMTVHGKGKQAKCYFAKYHKPSKMDSSKKRARGRIKEGNVTVSAKDEESLVQKIIAGFPFSAKFEKLRNVAVQEIRAALKGGRLTNISLFSFAFSYADAIKKYSSSFDFKFCYHMLCGTSLGSQILNQATEADYDNAATELLSSTKTDAEKMFRQLEILLNCAVKNTILFNSQAPVFTYIETRKKQIQAKAQMRDAYTKKTLTKKKKKNLINWLIKHITEKPTYLGTMIKLLTGMTNPEVSMLTWGDFCQTDYCDYYHFKVTKQRNYKSKAEESLSNPFKYRIVPIPVFLSDLILAQRERIQKQFKISYAELMGLPLITVSNENCTDFCSPNMLRLNSNKALTNGARIPKNIVTYLESDGTEKYDLSKYNGDFFASNFRFHALNDAMMTHGEVSYILGFVPYDTFSKHYCDFTNPFLQMKLVEKLNDWCSLYADWEGEPQINTGTANSDLKSRKIVIEPYNSGCTSGTLLLQVKGKCTSAIEISVSGDRGIAGTATIYEENNDGK